MTQTLQVTSLPGIINCSWLLIRTSVFQAFEELETLLAKHEICIAVKEKLVKDSGVAEEIAYDNIVQKLLTKPRARGKLTYMALICIYITVTLW